MGEEAVLFHVMLRQNHIVVFRFEADGTRTIFLPPGKSVEQVWPQYSQVAPFLDVWFQQTADQFPHTDRRSLGKMAAALTSEEYLHLWAYTTSIVIYVSVGQVAQAMGRRPSSMSSFRQTLEQKGLSFVQATSSKYVTPLGQVGRVLGQGIADGLLLYPHQIADYLGVSTGRASGIVKRLGIALERGSTTVAAWGRLRRVKRTGPRTFEVVEKNR